MNSSCDGWQWQLSCKGTSVTPRRSDSRSGSGSGSVLWSRCDWWERLPARPLLLMPTPQRTARRRGVVVSRGAHLSSGVVGARGTGVLRDNGSASTRRRGRGGGRRDGRYHARPAWRVVRVDACLFACTLRPCTYSMHMHSSFRTRKIRSAGRPCIWSAESVSRALRQGPTLVHFSAQPEPFLTQNTPYTPRNTPWYSVNTPETTPDCIPCPTESA